MPAHTIGIQCCRFEETQEYASPPSLDHKLFNSGLQQKLTGLLLGLLKPTILTANRVQLK